MSQSPFSNIMGVQDNSCLDALKAYGLIVNGSNISSLTNDSGYVTSGTVGPKGDTGANGATGANGPNIVSSSTTTALNGILKGNGSNVTTASAGTDYFNSSSTINYNQLSNTPTIPSVLRTSNSLSLSLVTSTSSGGTQISSSKDSSVKCTVSCTTTATIGGASTSLVILEMCSTNSATAGNWIEIGRCECDQTITLAVVLQSVQTNKSQICCDVPAGYYIRLRSSGSGTHSEAFVSGQQTIYG